MKNLNKAKLTIYILGIILIIFVFMLTIIPSHTHSSLASYNQSSLPQGVHIPININTANKETLCLLDGIGDTRANNIIAYREENGHFKTKEEIMEVYGIGEKIYRRIKNYICV